jgi:tRNA A37 threonylcarbamoyladenosine biosynthesis protein TsaE
VEWGDRFPEAAPSKGLSVSILIEGDTERRFVLDPIGERGDELAAAWAEAACRLGGESE